MSAQPPEELTPLKRALLAIDQLQGRLDRAERAAHEPVAVVGIGCRFPGDVDDPAAFWELLRSGTEAVGDVPAERWDVDAFYHPDPDHPGTMSTRRAAFLRDVRGFEPQFFGISPREAASMDPQQRLLLEVAWEALEHAGIAPDGLGGSRTGVFVGVTGSDYAQLQLQHAGREGLDAYHASGVAHSIASGRLSYVLGLQGPSLTLDTACSSSLVAIHLAVQSLRAGESRLALAGGANLILTPENSITLSKFHMLAPDGRCKTFDAAADGFGRGEGCGIVVLKLLRDALADGDRVLAVVRGSAVNQDGASSGLTAPNGPAQERVVRDALADGRVTPGEVEYVEAHGTGTALGDPIEVQALAAVYGAGRPADRPLQIGSVKTNVGHLEAVAGVAGFIKVVLSLQYGAIPPHLHLVTPNPFIDWDELPVSVPTTLTPWTATDRPRLAGVSAFGFSGTNAHVVLESAPTSDAVPVRGAPDDGPHLLVLSGRTAASARAAAARWATALGDGALPLAGVCATAARGRAHLAHRAGIVGDSVPSMRAALDAYAAGQPHAAAAAGESGRVDPPKIGLLFSGQGAQWSGMGRGLYAGEPVFRAALDRCAAAWTRHVAGPGLLDVLWGGGPALDDTAFTQPALFAVEWSLAEMWAAWGVSPAVVAGHSVGEFVAAAVAGVFTAEDGLGLVATRGRLMGSLPAGGTMAAVLAPAADVGAVIEDLPAGLRASIGVAAVNGVAHTVVSGAAAAVDAVVAVFTARDVRSTPLVVSHAFHSPLMQPIVDEFAAVAAAVDMRAPTTRIVSLVTGAPVGHELLEPAYWAQHVLAPVRYADGVASLRAAGVDVFLEAGPHPVLVGMATTDGAADGEVWVGSLRRDRDDRAQCLQALARVHVAGADIAWDRVAGAGAGSDRVPMPTTPFQRQTHWLPGAPRRAVPASANPVLGRRLASPLETVTFEAEFERASLPVLDDHEVFGTSILPAAAFLEAALSAVADVTGRAELRDVLIQEALLAGVGPTTLQTIVRPVPGGVAVDIYGRDGDRAWTHHVSARGAHAGAVPGATDALDAIRDRCPRDVAAADHYAALAAQGLAFGPALRVVTGVSVGDGEALGEIVLPAEAGTGEYGTHPALLDGALQTLAAIAGDLGDAYLPIGVERIARHGALGAAATAHVTLRGDVRDAAAPRTGPPETLVADLVVHDSAGRAQLELRGLLLKRADRAALHRLGHGTPESLYVVEWHEAAASAAPHEPGLPAGRRAWLVVADAGGVARSLAAEVNARGGTAVVVPGDAERTALDAALAGAPSGGFDVVVHLVALDSAAGTSESSRERLRRPLGSALDLAQALIAVGSRAHVTVVTRGAQPAGGISPDPDQAALWGFTRTLALEHPELRPVTIDLDPSPVVLAGSDLLDAMLHDDGEHQVALRAGARLVARLAVADRELGPSLPVELGFDGRGTIDELSLRPAVRRAPGAGEVEIEVHAAALNFKDVLNVLGMYPGDPGPLGSECAGVVVGIGSGVTDLAVGDAVVALAVGSLRSFVTCSAVLVVPKPAGMSFAEAAGLLIAQVTARIGLDEVAGLRRGERVLVHAGAGGVGLAAVDVARRAGAEIYATAGSDRKRALLRALGVAHVYDSRSLGFADGVLADTGGAGVDVVLNSLAGEFVQRSFDVLAAGGRFVEIGKRDLLGDAAGDTRSYTVVDWSDALRADPASIRTVMEAIVADAASGALLRMPVRTYPLHDAASAFRFMAQGRHVGKVVVTMPAATARPLPPLREDATYLVTGGLGGLGLLTASHLAGLGARHLALVGRRPPSDVAEEEIARLRAGGTRVTVVQADVSRPADVARTVEQIAGSGFPLRGVIHAAAGFDDGAIFSLDWDRMADVLAAKVDGLGNIERATADAPLEFLVAYSSVASVLGAPGQANYAAANAVLDAVAHRRAGDGLPSVSIDWGGWRDVGAAADPEVMARVAAHGLGVIDADDGLAALDRCMAMGIAQVTVAPIDWPVLLGRVGRMPLLTAMAATTAAAPVAVDAAAGEEVRRQLAAAPAARRRALLADLVREQTAHVLALPTSDVGDTTPLSDLGLDSLMTVELRNLLGALLALDEPLPATLVFDHPTVAAIAEHLGTVLAPAPGGDEPTVAAADGAPLVASLLDDMEHLSDAEIDAMLSRRSGL